ncbi:MAG: uracil-DNA glycosylase [Deltaproteobacteria bacterium]|nr:uracil-DNA glycosylase [Deltaproteobacteria bacterium]
MSKKPQIHDSWLNVLYGTFQQPFMQSLRSFLVEEMKSKIIYPRGNQIFAAFNHTPFDKVRVLILGQDPYHGYGQAHGLSFSVPDGIAIPPSLRNIFIERQNDLGLAIPQTGNLTPWTQQGVFMLNTVLTVRHREPNSHKERGWEQFTDAVIQTLSTQKDQIVFILWGSKAKQKRSLINARKHYIITSSHPSPYSAERGFFGSKPFSRCNRHLAQHGLPVIDWSI